MEGGRGAVGALCLHPWVTASPESGTAPLGCQARSQQISHGSAGGSPMVSILKFVTLGGRVGASEGIICGDLHFRGKGHNPPQTL